MTAVATPTGVGELLRQWRQRRRLSQLDLAVEAEVSPRHLSFVETGRSRPSRELLLHLAEHLDVPLRERNALLLAAGYAPVYQQTLNPVPEPFASAFVPCQPVEEWLYERGPGNLTATVRFRAGVVQSISDPLENFDQNGRGTLTALEAARRADVPRFVFSSSNAPLGEGLEASGLF